MFSKFIRYVSVVVFVFVGIVLFVFVVQATHSWGSYHWARMANPFILQFGNNVSSAWTTYLFTTASDWSVSDALDTKIVSGKGGTRCKATNGRVEVCSKKYGYNGWLGIAQIWVSGNHITQGTVKFNDTYFQTAKYNTPFWRQFVVCQEVGHTLGLDHQDEDFANVNLGTCMDYTSDPDGSINGQLSNLHPNQHDYDQLALIYAHLDKFNTFYQSTSISKSKPVNVGQDVDLDNPSTWGKAVKKDARGKDSLYKRDLGHDEKFYTFVIWAD